MKIDLSELSMEDFVKKIKELHPDWEVSIKSPTKMVYSEEGRIETVEFKNAQH